ncbi:flavin reductase family protein [Micromonospora sp. NPDC047707]|uniref:flavin reductase family protein n=1 Tax=Micromonospora sp. NPDC047707 TaxID=3154498 RepID=UPI003453DDCE
MRPLWRCRACGAHWPCQPARLALLAEYRHDRPALLIYLGTLMAEASAQLAQLNGHAPPTGLHERFLGWARARDGRMFHVNHEPGAEIHHTDPFAVPVDRRSPVRRLRGRLAAPVTLWTAPGPAGLTVSSTLVAEGEPDRLLGLIDPEADLWAAVEEAGRFAVAPLNPSHRQLADRFAGLFPSPGGLFATGTWTQTDYGPVPSDAGGWAGCRLDDAREYGWGLLVDATIETVELAEETDPLLHYRGRYRELT